MKKFLALFLLLPSMALAANIQPRSIADPLYSWGLHRIPDLTSSGTVTGATAAFTNLVSCTVAADAGGNLYCSTAAGSGTVTSISQGTNMSFSANPITNTGTISLTASPSVTNLTASGTVTGGVVSATSALQVGSDYVSDLTGSGLSIVGGALTSTGGSGTVTSISQGTNMSFSTNPITNTGTINLAASPSVTNLTASGTVTGFTVATTGTICSGTDKLTTDAGGNFKCATDQTGGGSAHNILSATHTDSSAASAVRGDLIVANSTPAWSRFGVGGANTVLTANATDPAWSSTPTVTNLTATGTVSGSTVTASSVLTLPINAGATGEGQVSWDGATNELYIGDASARIRVGKFVVGGAATTSRAVDFYLMMGGTSATAAETGMVMPFAVTCRNFYATVDDLPGAGKTWDVTVQEAGVADALTCQITNASTTCSLTGTDEAIPAGTMIRTFWNETGTVTATSSQAWSMECYPD